MRFQTLQLVSKEKQKRILQTFFSLSVLFRLKVKNYELVKVNSRPITHLAGTDGE